MLPLHHTITIRPTIKQIVFLINTPFFNNNIKVSYIRFDKIEFSIKILILMALGFEPRPILKHTYINIILQMFFSVNELKIKLSIVCLTSVMKVMISKVHNTANSYEELYQKMMKI